MVGPSVGSNAATAAIAAEPTEDGQASGPRGSQAQTQHLLLTLLGDYWYERDEYLPSAALVDLLAEFGVTAFSARAALNRLTRRALLRWEKRGRRTFYALTPRAAAVLTGGGRRIVSFGAGEASWDGRWAFVAFSVPEARRPIRHALRERLRWLGYALNDSHSVRIEIGVAENRRGEEPCATRVSVHGRPDAPTWPPAVRP